MPGPINTEFFGVRDLTATNAVIEDLTIGDDLTITDDLTVGGDLVAASVKVPSANGTVVTALRFGTVTVTNGQTSGAVALTGVTTASKIFASIQDGNSNGVTIDTAVPTADTVTVTVSGDPGADLTVQVLALN